ncbi:MAG: hypothetical protein ACLR7J_04635 [[Ruminococcus] torques]
MANILQKCVQVKSLSDSWMRLEEEPVPLMDCRIAWAVDRVYQQQQSFLGQRRLFATHYHELTELEGKIR